MERGTVVTFRSGSANATFSTVSKSALPALRATCHVLIRTSLEDAAKDIVMAPQMLDQRAVAVNEGGWALSGLLGIGRQHTDDHSSKEPSNGEPDVFQMSAHRPNEMRLSCGAD